MARLAASLVVVPLVSLVKQGGHQPEVGRLEKLLYPRTHILLVPIHVSVTMLLIQSHGGTFYSLSAHFLFNLREIMTHQTLVELEPLVHPFSPGLTLDPGLKGFHRRDPE
jgi:hypothetical protein